jgi:hypothetical protein
LIVPPESATAAFVEVTGLAARDLERVERSGMTDEAWGALLRVTVKAGSGADGRERPAMLGAYSVQAGAIRFTPRFPFDAGREYEVVFDPSRLATGESGRTSDAPVVAVISRPKAATTASAQVERIYPSGEAWPENQLRLYVQFSAPMGRGSGLEHVHLLDEDGREVTDPFLPLDVEFWNGDRTRYTFFFDPGRVKKGITPRNEMGPSLVAGRRYTLVVDKEWLDGEGLPLRESFRREIRVGPPDEEPLDPDLWRLAPPPAGTRDPLVVVFDKPLDHGLLLRALGVARGQDLWLDGEAGIEASETRWTFTPANAWAPGMHHLVVLSILEDRAGNRIGRAFEVDRFEEIDTRPEPERTLLPFRIGSSATN